MSRRNGRLPCPCGFRMLLSHIAPSLILRRSKAERLGQPCVPTGAAVSRLIHSSFALRSSARFFAANGAQGQCLLANPSFELGGSSGNVFGGWNQFGPVGSPPNATHGSVAARVSGPNLGGWDVAGYWQRLDCAPGESWSVSVDAWHTSTKPLTGQSKAIVNIEWRGRLR